MSEDKSKNLRASLVIGTLWVILTRWSIKGLGFISTLILARLLSPSDYGLVAMAMLVVGIGTILVDFGADTAILRQKDLTREDIDSAWTLKVVQGVLIALILLVVSPIAGWYFGDSRVIPIIWVIACSLALIGFSNIGVTLARKDLNFALEFRMYIIGHIVRVIVTIAFAYILKDYRAMVIGIATGYFFGLVTSYLMHPYRPKFCVTGIKKILDFSKWLWISGLGGYASRKVDEILAGRLGGAEGLGIYSMGSELGQLPTTEIGPPINRALLPTLSNLQGDSERMDAAVVKTIGAVCSLVLPVGVGLAMVANNATVVLLGDKWLDIVPFLSIFAISGAIRTTAGAINPYLLVLGRSNVQAKAVWVELLFFLISAYLMFQLLGLLGIAWGRLISSVAWLLLYVHAAVAYGSLTVSHLFKNMIRPVLSTLIMFVSLAYLPYFSEMPIINLCSAIFSGVFVYSVSLFLFWKMYGFPDGIEKMVYEFLSRKLSKN